MQKLIVSLAITALVATLAACDDDAPYKLLIAEGKLVYSSMGEKIGSIDEVVVDTGGNQFAVVSVGGFLGIGGKQILISDSNLSVRPEGGFYLNYSMEQIALLPEYQGTK